MAGMRVWLLLVGMWFFGAATLSELSPVMKVIFVCLASDRCCGFKKSREAKLK
jgi:hypothetical protein